MMNLTLIYSRVVMRLSTGLILFLTALFHCTKISATELIVGINNAGNPPLTFSQKDDEKGIYREILEQISQLSGHQFKYLYLPPKRLLFAFDKGEVHLEPGINPAWRSSAKLPGVYSNPFAVSENIILFAKNKRIAVRKPIDLLNRQVGTIRGYFYPGYMSLFESDRIKRLEGDSEYNLMSRMASGRIDQIFIQKDVAFYWMSKESRFNDFEVGNVNFKDPISFRIHPSKRHIVKSLNNAIERLNAEGKIEAIYNKYR